MDLTCGWLRVKAELVHRVEAVTLLILKRAKQLLQLAKPVFASASPCTPDSNFSVAKWPLQDGCDADE